MKIVKFVGTDYQTNIYLTYDEESKTAFLVDPGAPLEVIKDYIEKNGLSLEYILLTHAHGDHTGGVPYFKENYPDAKLVAGKAERKYLFNRGHSFGPGGIVADLEVKDGDTVDAGPMHLEFIETPGHTAGGISILMGDIIFSGDTLFHSSVGRTDLPGGDWDTLLKSLKEKLFVLPDDINVLPGHGTPTTIGFEKRYNPFV